MGELAAPEALRDTHNFNELGGGGIKARQIPPAQAEAFGKSRGTSTKTDWIDAKSIARFLAFHPEAARRLPQYLLYLNHDIAFPSSTLTKADDRAVHGVSTSWLDHACQRQTVGFDALDPELIAIVPRPSSYSKMIRA